MTRKTEGTSARNRKVQRVDAYLAALEHPCKAGVEALRGAILALDPRIGEEVKWNAPSFRLLDHFATFRLHPAPIFQLVLHAGAKPRQPPKAFRLSDPDGLAKWAAQDRCVLTFESSADACAKQSAVVAIVKEWIGQL
jgi:hypothetical protein